MKIKLFFIILLSVLCLNSITAQKNSKKMTIAGTVLDAAKSPIVNAIVMIDGQKTNSLTDSNGKYKIKVNRNASKIGIFTFGNGIIEETIGGRALIDFKFGTYAFQQLPDQNISPVEEGLNVGYNHTKKKYVTTEVSKIDGTNKKYASYSSIYDMISREVAGVRIYNNAIVIHHGKFVGIVSGYYVGRIKKCH